MSGRAKAADFTAWAETVLTGTGWTVSTVRGALGDDGTDLAAAALADGFAAAAKGLTEADHGTGGFG